MRIPHAQTRHAHLCAAHCSSAFFIIPVLLASGYVVYLIVVPESSSSFRVKQKVDNLLHCWRVQSAVSNTFFLFPFFALFLHLFCLFYLFYFGFLSAPLLFQFCFRFSFCVTKKKKEKNKQKAKTKNGKEMKTKTKIRFP